METESEASRPLSILQVLEKGRFSTGSVVQMFQLARGLAARGHSVAVVSRPGGELAARCREAGLDFIALPLRHEFDLASARRFARIYAERAVDLVHVHKGIAHSVALLATLWTRDRPALVVNRGVSFPLDVFNRLKFRVRLDAVVAVSSDIREVVIHSGRVPPEKVHVIHAGVDLARFDSARADRAKVRREWGITDEQWLLVQVGARDWKGWRDLLEATRRLAPDFAHLRTAVAACKDDAEQALVAEVARRMGIAQHVRTFGFRSDMPDVLAAGDAVADASWAGTGITGTIREAMALGKPVVASAIGGNPELVEDGVSGLVVPPRDPAALAAAVRRLLTEPALAGALGEAGRRRVVEGFSAEARLDRVEALYRALTAGNARREAREEATVRAT